MVLLFTTDPPNRPIYRRDILNVICRHAEETITFSYRKNQIHSTQQNSPASLKGKDAIVIFAEYIDDPNNPNNKIYKFHPIRKVIIQSTASGTYVFELKLKEFVHYSTDKNFNETVIRNINTELNSLKDSNAVKLAPAITSGSTLGFFVFSVNDTSINQLIGVTQNEGEWNDVVKYFAENTALEDSFYFRQSKKNKVDIDLADQNAGLDIKKIVGGKKYSFSLDYYSGKSVGTSIYPVVQTNENLSAQGPYIKQSNNGFLLEYALIPKRTLSSIYSQIVIKIPDLNTGSNIPKCVSPEISHIVEIRPFKGWQLSAICLMVGPALPPFFKELYNGEALYDIYFLRLPGNVLIAFWSVLGALIFGYGVFSAFRKLPVGG